MKNSIALKEERADVMAKLEEIKDVAVTEERDLTDDENTKVDELLKSVDVVDEKIERAEKLEAQLKRAASFSGTTSTSAKKEEVKLNRSFNITKAINQYIDGNLDGIEKELHTEAKRSNPGFSGLALPTGVLTRSNPQLTSNANEMIATDVYDWMGTLQNYLVLADAGATFLTGLSSNVQLPVLSETTAGWATEVNAAPDAATAIGGSTLVPHKLASYMDISKMLMAQTNGNIENVIKDDMNRAIAAALEAAILSDSDGTGASPVGAFDQAGTSMAGGAATLAKIIEMESDISANNANGTAYITSAKGRGILKQIVGNPGITGTTTGYASPLLNNDGTMNGHRCLITNNISDACTAGGAATTGGSETGILFGMWSDLVVGQFGNALDVVVDPYSQSINGEIRIVINSFWDSAFRRTGSFCRGSITA
tara:strand:+ start:5383 stop:6660 length:1278 start_codon:yes stop_codon:yes gene_type:complete